MMNRTLMSHFRPRSEVQDEKTITIPKNKNATTVQVSNHRWVAICRGDEEIMRDESPGGMVNFQLPPGEYVVRTDGKIDTVSFATVERPTMPGRPAGTVSVLDQLLMEGKPIGTPRPAAATATGPALSHLPPDLIKRILRYAEVRGRRGLDQQTIDRIIETGELPDHVSLSPDLLARLRGHPGAGVLALPIPASTEEPTPTEIELDALPVVLDVTVEAPGRNPVDGMPEVPADGKAFCTINLSKLTVAGQALNRAKDTDEIYLRTTGGQLVNARGKLQHKLQLNKGKASFRLVSETTPRFVTVSILSPTLQKVDVHIDFVTAG